MQSHLHFFSSQRLVRLMLVFIFIFPILFTNPTQTVQASGGPLKVVGRFLQDANGNPIMMRGVNVSVYRSGSVDDFNDVASAVAKTKANVARLEWWAIPPAGATQYTASNLDRALYGYNSVGILPILELHDLTFREGHDAKTGPNSDGNDQTLFANTITNFWTRPDILPILLKHQSHLVINLANEWGSSTYSNGTSTATNFIANYTKAIAALRAVGITAPLMIDAPRGSDYQFILNHGAAILNADPQKNILLSLHTSWAASQFSDTTVNTILDKIKNSGLPVILGEVPAYASTAIQCDPVHYGNLLKKANTNLTGYLLWTWYGDDTCGPQLNLTVNGDGITIPTSQDPGFSYNALNNVEYGINTASPATTKVTLEATVNSKTLVTGRAIASWLPNIPANEKRPVLVVLPGWTGAGSVNAKVYEQNKLLVNEGYITLAIGFDSKVILVTNIEDRTLEGLDKLCADTSIPADCNAIALVGSSYGGSRNYWIIEHLRANGYDGSVGSKGHVIAFLSQDTGYAAPGTLTNPDTGAFTRSGLADTKSYSVAMMENLGDGVFQVDSCTWGNCGARVLSNAHYVRGDQNVLSICPAGGGHGLRGFADWNNWLISALKVMIHVQHNIPTFTNYTAPTLSVGNTCLTHKAAFKSDGAADGWILESDENSNQGGALNTTATLLNLGDNATNKQFVAILSFNTGAALPDHAAISKATLKIKINSTLNSWNPTVMFHGLLVEIKNGAFGTPELTADDFQAAPSQSYGPFSLPTSSGWRYIDLTNAKSYINTQATDSGVTQIRLRFQLDDNNNNIANLLKLYSGNAAPADRPQLWIEYGTP